MNPNKPLSHWHWKNKETARWGEKKPNQGGGRGEEKEKAAARTQAAGAQGLGRTLAPQ